MISANESTARELASALMEDVAELLILRAKADVLNEEIGAIHDRVLNARVYMAHIAKRGDRPARSYRITKRGESFLMSEEDSAHYFATVDALIQADPRYDVKAEYCPALIAESAVRNAERALVDKSSRWLGVTTDDLLCSKNGLERYRKYIDLLCKLCASA